MAKRILFFIFLLFFTLDARADEGIDQEQAVKKAKSLASIDPADYRQKLKKTIAVEEAYFPQEIDSYVRYTPFTGAKSQSGKVGIIDASSEYTYEVKAFGKLPVEFAVGSRYLGIDNSTLVKLPARLTAVNFGLATTLPFFNLEKTYFCFGIAPSFYSDNWNFNSSSFRLPQRYFLVYQPDKKWTFICGVGVYPDFADEVWPILGFIYKPNERLAFNIVPDNPEITYELNKKFTLFAQGEFNSNEFEVTRDNQKNVVLEYNEMHLGAGLRYSLNKHIKSSFSVGSMFNRSIKYRQDSLGKVAVNSGFYTEFRLDIMI